MQPPAEPHDEAERLQALRDLGVLDTQAEDRFDRITRLAAKLFNVPISLVSLVDVDRQWFKSRYGLDATETPRTVSFCAHSIPTGQPLVVPNALRDHRFHDNPLVTGSPNIRFYAGIPLRGPQGHKLGTFCIIDRRPRTLNDEQIGVLHDLAAIVQSELHDARLVAARRIAHHREVELAAKQRELVALKRVDRERQAFIQGAAHAFRTPLTPLRTQVELLKMRLGNDDGLRDAAQRIDSHVAQIVRLLDRLQVVASLQAGTTDPAYEPTQLRAAVTDALEQTRKRLGQPGISLANSVSPQLRVPMDRDHLCALLFELLTNAVHAAGPDEPVVVNAARTGRHTTITIRDHGPGLREATHTGLARFTHHQPTSLTGAGEGLGLQIVQHLIALYGGTLAHAPAPDGGTVATLSVPHAPAPGSRPARGGRATPVAPSTPELATQAPAEPPGEPERAPAGRIDAQPVTAGSVAPRRGALTPRVRRRPNNKSA